MWLIYILILSLLVALVIYSLRLTMWAIRVRKGCKCGAVVGATDLTGNIVNRLAEKTTLKSEPWTEDDLAEFGDFRGYKEDEV